MKKFSIVFIVLILLLALSLVACGNNEENNDKGQEVILTLKNAEPTAEIDIYQTTYVSIDLPALFNESLTGLVYEVTANSNHLTLGNVSNAGKINIISDGTTGEYLLSVKVQQKGKEILTFSINLNVVDGAPIPTIKKQINDLTLAAPVFPGEAQDKTYMEYSMDMTEYFDAASNVTYIAECADGSVTMTAEEAKPYKITLYFAKTGTKQVTIYAVQNGERKVSLSFNAVLTSTIPNQLINGGFEEGFTGWNTDEWTKDAYSVYDSNVDIWGNGIDNDGKYLYGYKNESGTCEFTSSLFKVGGTGYITWKMAGNGTQELQFSLMQYVEEGEDVEIAKFNNWYYIVYAQSGFIFRQYYYVIDSQYQGSTCYFKVVDDLSVEFAFVNLDSIVTYYSKAPNVSAMYKAGFCEDPDGVEIDMTDTSRDAFPDLSEVGYQLLNGDFEQGYTGWYMTTAEKNAYSIYGSKTDIWNNQVNGTGNYIYGYFNESFASANFHSSLFKVGGTGLITWKMAGNSTADLKFSLVKYNPTGEDEVIATFNNWYFPISQESGFIFRQYKYQIDMEELEDAYCYFRVEDYRAQDFGFICLDDIVTYYETVPSLTGTWYDAGFVTDPSTK